jgi:hypothetical protein
MSESTFKPFHESIVDAINIANGGAMSTLAALIKSTKIPKGHDEIVDAWNARVFVLGLNDDLGVADSVMAQKQPETAAA